MKEATGELNMTVVTVVAIAAVAAFFYAFIWPSIKSTIMAQSICANGQHYKTGTSSQAGYVSCGNATNGKYTCSYSTEENGNIVTKSVTCSTK